MATSPEYRDFVLDQLSCLEGITCRAMMGEYLLYYQGKLFGGLYDNRLLVKPVKAAVQQLPQAPLQQPYPGAKEMLLVEDLEDRDALAALVEALYTALPAPKPKKPKKASPH